MVFKTKDIDFQILAGSAGFLYSSYAMGEIFFIHISLLWVRRMFYFWMYTFGFVHHCSMSQLLVSVISRWVITDTFAWHNLATVMLASIYSSIFIPLCILIEKCLVAPDWHLWFFLKKRQFVVTSIISWILLLWYDLLCHCYCLCVSSPGYLA